MPWKEFEREDRFRGSNKPFITIGDAHFGFNAQFVRQTNLLSFKFMSIYVDEENHRLGFEFHNDEQRENAFKLSQQSSEKKGVKRTGMQATSRAIAIKYPWIAKISKLPPDKRRFTPRKEQNLWVVQLPK